MCSQLTVSFLNPTTQDLNFQDVAMTLTRNGIRVFISKGLCQEISWDSIYTVKLKQDNSHVKTRKVEEVNVRLVKKKGDINEVSDVVACYVGEMPSYVHIETLNPEDQTKMSEFVPWGCVSEIR